MNFFLSLRQKYWEEDGYFEQEQEKIIVRLGPGGDDDDDDDDDDDNEFDTEEETDDAREPEQVQNPDEVLDLGALYGENWALIDGTEDGIDLEGQQFQDESDLLPFMVQRPRKRGRFNPNFVGTRLNFGNNGISIS
jgi:hypothetical protein